MAATRKTQASISPPSKPICLPLHKFSSAVVLRNSAGPLPWTHLSTQGDLFALFDVVRTVQNDGSLHDTRRFKILRDPDVLEDLDVDVLATESRRAIDMARDASDHNRDHNVAVIKKLPVIAVKYPMSHGQVKRFQIRFRDDPDYYEALKQLSNSGVHMLEAGTFPTKRPQIEQRPQMQQGPSLQQNHSTPPQGYTPAVSALDSNMPRPSVSEQETMLAAPVLAPRVNPLELQYFREQSVAHNSLTANQQPILAMHGAHTTDTQWREQLNHQAGPITGITSANIDLYTPRQSTAPARTSQHLSQLLPPPRELPFKTRSEPKATARCLPGSITKHAAAFNDANDNEEIIPDSQATRDTPEPSQKRAKTTTSKKAPTSSQGAKKKRAPAYKCDACKAKGTTRCRHKQKSPPLPSIEEVLTPNDDEAVDGVAFGKELDTQILLARSTATKKSSRVAKIATTNAALPIQARLASYIPRVTRAMSVAASQERDSVRGADSPAPASPEKIMAKSTKAPPCTPAAQLLPQHPRSPPSGAAEQDLSSPELPCNVMSGLQLPSAGAPFIPPAAKSRTPARPQHSSEVLDTFFEQLSAHPSFANANDKLTRFADLSKVEQENLLSKFMLGQLANPNFKLLCEAVARMIDVSWGVGWSGGV